jgi:polyhydroxyalkanoate synthesis regulator phasin
LVFSPDSRYVASQTNGIVIWSVADAPESARASVEELKKRTADISTKSKSDENKRGAEGRPARGAPMGMTADQLEKWNKLTPEEKKKAREEMMKNLTPEQRAQMEEARKRFGGGDGKGGDGKADGKGGPKPDAPADAKPGEKTSEKPTGKPAEPAAAPAAPAVPAQGGGR